MKKIKVRTEIMAVLVSGLLLTLAACSSDDNGTGPSGTWAWSAMGDGVEGPVWAIEVIGDEVFVGGDFSAVGVERLSYVRRWDGSDWVGMGDGLSDLVRDLLEYNGQLFAAGLFQSSGDSSIYGVAQWDGTRWNRVGNELPAGTVGYDLAVYDGNLYASMKVGDQYGVAGFNGTAWSAINQPFGYVYDMCVFGGELIISGLNTSLEPFVAAWDGASLDLKSEFHAYKLCVYDGALTSYFYDSGPLCAWDGSQWTAIDDQETNYEIDALAVYDNKIVVGAHMDSIGSVKANSIAAWNGSSWSALGEGLTGDTYTTVTAMEVDGSNLYVGGTFDTAGDQAANNIAVWHYKK